MDGKVKNGHVVLKAGVMRSKQKKWCVFYNKSENDQVLEFYDSQEDAKKNSKHKKSYQLKHVKSIDTVNKASSKDYYIDIYMKKDRLTLCFDCENDLEDWSTVLHNYVVIISSDGGSGANVAEEEEDGSTFKSNMLYESSEDTIVFDVTIEPTAASDKKHLEPNKPYRLLVTMTNLALEDPSKEENTLLFRWMYEFIRSYGTTKATGLFTITAGRRSETGEGEFSFKVANPKSIEQAIDLQTQRKLSLKLQHSRIDDSENSSESLRNSRSSKRPLSSPAGKGDTQEVTSRSSLKGSMRPDKGFQKELNANIASRQSDKQKSSKKSEEKEKDKKDEKDKKEDKKGGFHLFKKKDKKGKEAESIEPKPLNQQQRASLDDHIYDEAVPQIQPVLSPIGDVYSVVPKKTGNWRSHGQQSEVHTENYSDLSAAAKENKGKKMLPPPLMDNDDYNDNTYDTLQSLGGEKPRGDAPAEGLYGISSGRPLDGIVSNSEEDEETYDDVMSVQRKANIQYQDDACEYETVDIDN
ncbi:uncharacterized protein DDB_G0284459-like [Argopecten irradians]|uniref:uncharacterized protein DDB_G0284459-like n=1 Tax=Argopecten irradians TaxID=31199 RepID=UPI0037109D63